MGNSRIDHALEAVVRALDEAGIPYCLVGAMALNRHGYRRFTEDIDLLVTREGHAAFKSLVSETLRDTANGVTSDFLIAGEFPGDGKPKPVVFPDPSSVAEKVDGLSLIPLPRLIELKLASGMTAPHRIKDLADVLELIRAARLPVELGDSLDAFVREKYRELWQAAQAPERD